MHWTDRILDADRSAFLAINGAHNPALDTLMWYVSGSVVWVPLYLLFLVLIKVRWGWRGLWWSLAAVAVLVLFTDTGSVLLFKNTVQRLRPSHATDLQGMVHALAGPDGQLYLGGDFGFVSNHAANHFGIAVFMAGVLQRRPVWAVLLLVTWALLIGYSRVYLGVHYPGDVIVGGLYGGLCGLCAFRLFLWMHQRSSAT
ncbi:MAG: phosphatase PAP2 family protein [Flavobacteriales bacterium]|nr:phosphatase PAP2 family protein [Flavobacteriales bacterium]MBL0045476.1 phosphatase PAP2 family protein [Flavobacteriales bacterium]